MLHGGAVVITAASQQEGTRFKSASRLGPFSVEFGCSPSGGIPGFSPVTPAPSHSPKTYMLDSKMTLGVNVSLSQCLFLCVTPAIDWCSVCGLPHLLPCNRCDRLLPPKTLN